MKLKQVTIQMFRNILDSGPVDIQSDVTCLVGKNESGKTAFLQALWRINPARGKNEFSVPTQYPAWLEKKHRIEGRNLDKVCPVSATYVLETEDLAAVERVFGPGVTPRELVVRRLYNNELRWTVEGFDEKVAVENLITGANLPAPLPPIFRGAESFGALTQALAAERAGRVASPDEVVAIERAEANVAQILGGVEFAERLWQLLQPRLPQYLYFSEYSKLPYTVDIKRVLGNGELTESELTARALLRLGGADQEYLLNPDYERRKRELENVANALTEDVLRYWSQNSQLRVQPDITQRTEVTGKGHHAVLDEMKVRIWDNRHLLSLPFDEHSAGFQWFFSFLAAFSEFESSQTPTIILLDEPAVGLHARAQADFLRFIEERLTKCQVLYTTHSPFMVQPGKLERVRLVEDKGKEIGATISADVLSRDADTLFPLQSALGYDLVQHLFVAEHNLVVEGTSDYAYLRVVSDYLAAQSRMALDGRWSIVPVGGADAIPTFVALLGSHLNITVVVDSRKEGHQRLQRLASEGYLEKRRIILVGDVVGRQADIEDLFEPTEYLELYNKAFGQTLTPRDLTGSDRIVAQISRHVGDRFDHGRPADAFLRERDRILPTLSAATFGRFEELFKRINSTI